MDRETEFILSANEKGGTAKTTTVILLGNCLTALGYHVLAVDLDPSGNLTAATLPEFPKYVIYDVFNGACQPEDAIVQTDSFDVLPTMKDLATGDEEQVPFGGNRKSLGDYFASKIAEKGSQYYYVAHLLRSPTFAPVFRRYDFVLIDSGPSDNLIVSNCILAADSVIIPCEPTSGSHDGLVMFARSLKITNDCYGQTPFAKKLGCGNAKIDGLVLSRCTEDWRTRRNVLATIHQTATTKNIPVYRTKIRKSPAIETAMNECKPVLNYMYYGTGAADAMNFTLEFLAKRGLAPRKLYPGVLTDENGMTLFRKSGDKFFTYAIGEDGIAYISKKNFRTEYLEKPEWVEEIGKKHFFHLDSLVNRLESEGITYSMGDIPPAEESSEI